LRGVIYPGPNPELEITVLEFRKVGGRIQFAQGAVYAAVTAKKIGKRQLSALIKPRI
jgi:hypothetical protein